MLALENHLVCCFAGGLTTTEEHDLIANFLLLAEELGKGDGLIKALNGRHISGNGTRCNDDFIKAAERTEVIDFGIKTDINTLLFDLSEVPLNELFVILFEAHGRSREEHTTEVARLLKDGGHMAALLQNKSTFHTANTAANNRNLLRFGGRDDFVAVVLHRRRSQSATGKMQRIFHGLDVCGAFVLCKVEAAVVAADARLNVFFLASKDFINPLGVNKVLAGNGNCIETTCCDFFSSENRIHTAGTDNRSIGEVLDMLDFCDVAVVRHVLRRMCPIPCIVGTVVAVEHGIAGFFEVFDSLFRFCHITAEFHKVFPWHSAFVPALRLGNDRVTQGNREIISGVLMDALNNFNRETEAVFKRSAIFVFTIVPVGNGKLVKQIAFVHGMDFYTVDAGVAKLFRRFTKGFNHLVDFFDRHRAGIHAFNPTVRGFGSRCAAILNIEERLCELAKSGILEEVDHHAVNCHGSAKAGRQLNEQLSTILMKLGHPLGKFFEHAVILVQPALTHSIAHALHAGKHKAHIVFGSLQKVICSFLIKVAGFQPAKKRGAAHGTLDNAVFNLHIADLPRGKEGLIFFVHAHTVVSFRVFIADGILTLIRYSVYYITLKAFTQCEIAWL